MKTAAFFTLMALSVSVAWAQADANQYATADEALAAIGITPERIKKEAIASQDLLAMKAYIENQDPDAYGGAWIDRDASGEPYPVVAIKKSLRKKINIKYQENIVFVDVKFSLKELQEAQQKITQTLMPADYNQAAALKVGIIDNFNRVEIFINPEHEEEALLRLNRIDLPSDIYKIFITDARIDGLGRIYPGTPMTVGKASGDVVCTNGFNGRMQIGSITNVSVFITAGHCAIPAGNGNVRIFPANIPNYSDTPPPAAPGEFVGQMLINWFGDQNHRNDIGIFVNANWAHSTHNNIHNEPGYLIGSMISQAPIGVSVCSYGAMSKWRCGTVNSGEQSIYVNNQLTYGIQSAKFCGRSGDSGGPVVRNIGVWGNYHPLGVASGIFRPSTVGGGSGPISNCLPNSALIIPGYETYFQKISNFVHSNGISLEKHPAAL